MRRFNDAKGVFGISQKSSKKTNAVRILDGMGIGYRLVEYEVDEDDLSAEHVARVSGIPLERVFKTLVVRGDKSGIFMVVIPGGGELDAKAAAAVSGNKKVEMVPLKEVQPLTGYMRGGCSPVGTKKKFPVYIDQRAAEYEYISVSAGLRGLQMLLLPEDLRSACDAYFVNISKNTD